MESTINYQDFINRLRDEAEELKECFTKFSFQAILFTSAALGFIGTFGASAFEKILIAEKSAEKDYFALLFIIISCLACVSVIIFLLNVSRVGLYKYTSSNRHFSYELHLSEKLSKDNLKNTDFNWEEKMVGWRVVQATLFDVIYKNQDESFPSLMFPKRNKVKWVELYQLLKANYSNDKYDENPTKKHMEGKVRVKGWFLIHTFVVDKTKYHAGSYLKKMMSVLHLLAVIVWFIMVSFFMVNAFGAEYNSSFCKWISISISGGIVFFAITHIIYSLSSNKRRRKIVESELLSIYCGSVVWRIVDITIDLAKAKQKDASTSEKIHYLKCLSEITKDWKDKVFEWPILEIGDYKPSTN